jgi:hypothetical protein
MIILAGIGVLCSRWHQAFGYELKTALGGDKICHVCFRSCATDFYLMEYDHIVGRKLVQFPKYVVPILVEM